MSSGLGRRQWSIPGGRVPLATTGIEPAMTSRDELRLLNSGSKEAIVEVTVIYSDREPVGPYQLRVAPRRLRRVRINDLIDPLPVPLDTEYALTIESSVPIVVQFTRMDTSARENATMGTLAFADE